MLNDKEIMAKEYMFEVFIPSIHELIKSRNSEEYEKWGGNCCRQSAIFGAVVLSEILPEYTWTVWDGVMDDVIRGKEVNYNHAWIFGKCDGKRLLVDLSRQYQERLFIEVKVNGYPKDHPEYANMVITSREQLDWKKAFDDDLEYYTQLSGKDFYEELIKISQPYAYKLVQSKRRHL